MPRLARPYSGGGGGGDCTARYGRSRANCVSCSVMRWRVCGETSRSRCGARRFAPINDESDICLLLVLVLVLVLALALALVLVSAILLMLSLGWESQAAACSGQMTCM